MFLKFIKTLKQKIAKKITALLKCGHKLDILFTRFITMMVQHRVIFLCNPLLDG